MLIILGFRGETIIIICREHIDSSSLEVLAPSSVITSAGYKAKNKSPRLHALMVYLWDAWGMLKYAFPSI